MTGAHVSLSCEVLSGPAMLAAIGDVGPAALALFVSAAGYAAERLTDGLIVRGALRRLTDHGQPGRVAAALVRRGLFSETSEGWLVVGYLEANPSRADIDARRAKEQAKKVRQRGGDDLPPSPGDTPGDNPGDNPGDGPGDKGGDNPGDSSVSLSGSPSPLSSEEKHSPPENPRGEPAPGGATPGESRGESLGDNPGDKPAAPVGSPRGTTVVRPRLPATRDLAQAYRAGVTKVTGAPCGEQTEPWNVKALEAIARTHAGGRLGNELLAWVTETATKYATARRDSEADQGKGFQAERCKLWLDAGAPASRPGGRGPARTSVPQPATVDHDADEELMAQMPWRKAAANGGEA